MANVKFIEPGGDADFGIGLWNFSTGTPFPAPSTTVVHGNHQRSLLPSNATGGASSTVRQAVVASDAGGRISTYIYMTAYPTNANTSYVVITQAGGGTTVIRWRLTSSGALQLWDSAAQRGSNGSTLLKGQWYRITLAWTITSTSVNQVRLYVNGRLDISLSNVTITTVSSSDVVFGNASGDPGIVMYFSDMYVDDDTSLADTGDVWVTAKRPYANGTTNGFTTQIGSGGSGYGSGHAPQVNERPLSTTNGWSMAVTGSAITEEYTIEGSSVGDLSVGSQIGYMGWLSASSLASETAQIVYGGSTFNISLTSTTTVFNKPVTTATYPGGGTDIGIITATTSTTVSLYECGVIVAYIPAIAPSPPIRIPNKFVGPMAMRKNFRQPYVPLSVVSAGNLYTQALTATSSFTGSYGPTTTNKTMAGTQSFTGSIARSVIHQLTAGVSFAGAITRQIVHTLTSATLSFTGSIVTGKALNAVLTASVGFVGAITKGSAHILSLAGALSFSGSITRQDNKSLSATASFTGSQSRSIVKGMTASLSFTGSIVKQLRRSLSGLLSFVVGGSSSISRISSQDKSVYSATTVASATYPGATTSGHLLLAIAASTSTANISITAGGTWTKVLQQQIGASGYAVALFYKLALGTETTITATGGGNGTNISIFEYSGNANPIVLDGTAAANSSSSNASTFTSPTITTTNANDLIFLASGTQFNAISSWTTSTLIGVGSGGTPFVAAGEYIVSSTQSGFSDTAHSTTNAYGLIIAAFEAASGTGGLFKQVGKSLTAVSSFSGSVARSTVHGLAAVLSFTGSVAKLIVKVPFTAVVSFTGAFIKGSAHLVNLAGGLSFSGLSGKTTSKNLLAAASFSGSQSRLTTKSATGSLSFAGATVKSTSYPLAGVLSFVGSLSRTLIPGGGGETLDATSSGIAITLTSGGTCTVSHTIGSGSNRLLIVSISIWNNGGTAAGCSSVTYGGTSMTAVGNGIANGSAYTEQWVLVAPTTGTANIVATVSGQADKIGVAGISFFGADQTTGIDTSTSASGTTGSVTASLTTAAANEYIVDAVDHLSANNSSSHTNTAIYSDNTNSNSTASQYELASSSGSNSMSYTYPDPGDGWAYSVLAVKAASGSAYTKVLSATLGFSSAVGRQSTKTLVAATSFSGNINRLISKGISGTVSFTGITLKAISHGMSAAALSFTGGMTRQVGKTYAATVPFSGAMNRRIGKSMSASLSFSGSTVRRTVHGLAATLSFIGAITKFTIKTPFTATISFSGSFIKGAAHFVAMTASQTFNGSINRATSKNMTATASFTGSQVRSINKGMQATVSFAGALRRNLSRSFSAALSFVGAFTRGSAHILGLSGTVSFTGSANKATTKNLTASVSSTGAITRRLVKSIQATVSFSGSIGRRLSKGLTATLSTTGALITATTRHLLFSGILSSTGSIAKQINKPMNGTVTSTGSMARQTSRSFTATLSIAGSIGRAIAKTFSVTTSFTGSISKRVTKSLTAATSFTVLSVKGTTHYLSLNGSLSASGTLMKATLKQFAASIGFVGSLLTLLRAFLRPTRPINLSQDDAPINLSNGTETLHLSQDNASISLSQNNNSVDMNNDDGNTIYL